ncbi:probable G-protein coupled receptor 139, partial [Stegostoma tigrinum]|uniref:probable G-protein coupled receptor 139 n=1 Tax=Stegostoma tigrinum TaxID=3053191 RepID=UPI0028701536
MGALPTALTGISSSTEMSRRDQNLRTIEWNVPTFDQNLRTIDWTDPAMDQHLRTSHWNVSTMDRSLSDDAWFLATFYNQISLSGRIKYAVFIIQYFYYPILATVGVPINVVTIYVLLYKDCGLSPCVRRYLGAMAVADLLVIILDLILRHIPIVYKEQFYFLWYIPVCNIHAILLYAASDCSVWFTVTFTFDRFVAICCQKLKSQYCSEKTVTLILGAVTVLSCLKNIFWYFMLSSQYALWNVPWFCDASLSVYSSRGVCPIKTPPSFPSTDVNVQLIGTHVFHTNLSPVFKSLLLLSLFKPSNGSEESLLGPQLFTIYTNHLEDRSERIVAKFA